MTNDAPWQASLWDFATAVYSQPQVESLSLGLQDRHNANVNILLWAVWLQEENIQLSLEVLDDVIATVEAVSLVTVNRLRMVRRDIKEMDNFTKVQSQMISKLILNAELAIEKVLLHRLQDMTLKFMEVMPDKVQPVSLLDYLKRLNLQDAEQEAMQFREACRSNTLA